MTPSDSRSTSHDQDTQPSDFGDKIWARPVEELISQQGVDPNQGLSRSEVQQRRKRFGPNRLREAKRRSGWLILVDQFKSVVVVILFVAAVLAAVAREWPEAIAVAAVILVNGLIGFITEWRAIRSMESLRRLGSSRVRVRRDGREREVAVDALVPGDIVYQEGGDIVPADVRLIEANNVHVDEAALTGESAPVIKRVDPAEEGAPLAERHSMLYRGTTVTEGSAEGLVVETGMQTELGRIAEMAEEAGEESTPLEQRLNQLGSRLAWIVLGVASVIAVAGLAVGREPRMMIETAIALGIAAVPEGLPIVATIALARGMWLMAQRQALINRLTAVETLGATQVIFTDKTGTLTENRMTLSRVVTPSSDHEFRAAEGGEPKDGNAAEDPLLRRVIELGVLCNNASLADVDNDGEPDEEQGDPTEVALLRAGLVFDIDRATLLDEKPELREEAFDPDRMMMATLHQGDGHVEVAVKGAPESVLSACTSFAEKVGEQASHLSDQDRQRWIDQTERMADEGLRVLAVADKHVNDADADPYEDLRFVGLVGLYDPPGEGVKDSIVACRHAGIRLVMVTGDQAATARAIGREVGMAEDDSPALSGRDLSPDGEVSADDRAKVLRTPVFARVSPEQKLRILQIYQDDGQIVAMTGDGINDAPALKKANIGVAMGRRGTDAAREAADMVLKDDSLKSIVAAVEQGRVIFDNIRKSVMFMLCTNVAEILAVATAALAGLTLPIRPLQILFLNIITDVFPALALGIGPGDPRVMEREPRDPKESLLTFRHWAAIGSWSGLVGASVLAALLLAIHWLQLEAIPAVTVSFLTLGFSKLWFVLNLRDRDTPIWDNSIVRNRWVWGAIALCTVLLLMAVYLPGLSTILKTESPGMAGWLLLFGMSLVPVVVGQTVLVVRSVAGRREHGR